MPQTVSMSSFKFFWQAAKENFISARVTFRPFKDVQGRDFGANRKRAYDFLLVRHSNLGPIMEILQVFCAPDPIPITPHFGGVPLHQIAHVGVSRAEALNYSAMKLFSKNSNLHDQNQSPVTRTSHTDRQTDRQTPTDRWTINHALRSIAQ